MRKTSQRFWYETIISPKKILVRDYNFAKKILVWDYNFVQKILVNQTFSVSLRLKMN